MFFPTRFVHDLYRLTVVGALGTVGMISSSVCRAELLFEQHQGGPAEYREVAGFNHSADFQVTEAIRIQAITGWFEGPAYDITFSGPYRLLIGVSISDSGPFSGAISVYSPSGPKDYFATFDLVPPALPPPGQKTPPGSWSGMGSLNWDLEPGTYNVNFYNAIMPLTYGYDGPLSHVSGFGAFNSYLFQTTEVMDTSAFGVRIYGRALSAVPEPSVYGTAGGLMLVAAVIWSRRRRVSRQRPLIS